MREYFFQKDYKLIGERNIDVKISESDSLIKIRFEEDELALPEYKVFISNDGNGTAVATPTKGIPGTVVTLSNTPNTGYKLSDYEVLNGGVEIFNNRFEIKHSNVEIRADFEVITYTVSFNMQGYGLQVLPETIEYGQTATEPTTPIDTQAIFGGWYTDAQCTNAFDFDTPIFEDITLYAKWDVVCLTFSSDEPFTVKIRQEIKSWDGTLEYSTNTKNWSEWDGVVTLNSGDDNKLHLRGINNTVITGVDNIGIYRSNLELSGNNIYCTGNIESILDYQTVAHNMHPNMGDYCYQYLFVRCASLMSAPELPATTLTKCCYFNMFSSCTSLVSAPSLPATTLASFCYANMFQGCTSLVHAPELPATTLAPSCYAVMFNQCTNLTIAPELPATTLENNCYDSMFFGCTSLTTAPQLPATTLADYCYNSMFGYCTSLATLPNLTATVLSKLCYYSMFEGCTSIKLSQTQNLDYTTPYRIPTVGTGEMATSALLAMFTRTGGTFTGTPIINTTYYLHKDNRIIY